MTMADRIVVMNGGRIEQAGTPTELYERPTTSFVASFVGVSNLLAGTVAAPDRVRLSDGTEVSVPAAALAGRAASVAIGIRPEKIRLGAGEVNVLAGTVVESAYIGVSTQYIVETPAGSVTVYVQNERAGTIALASGERLTLSWSPESTFVVDPPEATA
jgi:spermidine/putrescine transport system ATP-binding protein